MKISKVINAIGTILVNIKNIILSILSVPGYAVVILGLLWIFLTELGKLRKGMISTVIANIKKSNEEARIKKN